METALVALLGDLWHGQVVGLAFILAPSLYGFQYHQPWNPSGLSQRITIGQLILCDDWEEAPPLAPTIWGAIEFSLLLFNIHMRPLGEFIHHIGVRYPIVYLFPWWIKRCHECLIPVPGGFEVLSLCFVVCIFLIFYILNFNTGNGF